MSELGLESDSDSEVESISESSSELLDGSASPEMSELFEVPVSLVVSVECASDIRAENVAVSALLLEDESVRFLSLLSISAVVQSDRVSERNCSLLVHATSGMLAITCSIMSSHKWLLNHPIILKAWRSCDKEARSIASSKVSRVRRFLAAPNLLLRVAFEPSVTS